MTTLARSGVAQVVRLVPLPSYAAEPRRPTGPSLTDGTLALRLDEPAGMPAAPGLRVLTGARSDVEGWATRFVQAVVEVLSGDRNAHQLVRCTSPAVYDDLCRRAAQLNRVLPSEQRRRRLRLAVRSVHVFSPTPGTAEVAAHVSHGQRSRAVAARLELLDSGWRCTALEFG